MSNNPTSNASLNSSIESVNTGGGGGNSSTTNAPAGVGGTNQNCDRQYMIVVSEKQARVIALPSHDCIFKQQLAESDYFVVKAEVTLYNGNRKSNLSIKERNTSILANIFSAQIFSVVCFFVDRFFFASIGSYINVLVLSAVYTDYNK